MRMQTPSPMPSQNYAMSATHRATQKDRKLQTLIEVCSDFASLSPSVNIHRPAEQAFAVEEDDHSEEMFAMMDRSQWSGQGVSEPTIPPSLAP